MAKARTLQQIITELKPTYAAQAKSLQEQANLIPQQIETEEQALNAKKDQAFRDILSGARRRGLGFSGIPLAEQAQYASTEFAPALARLRDAGHERALSLQQAILGINERRDTLARQIYQQEQDRAFQAEQARLAREAQERSAARAAAAAAQPTMNLQRQVDGLLRAEQERVAAIQKEAERNLLRSLMDNRGAVSGHDLRNMGWSVPNF